MKCLTPTLAASSDCGSACARNVPPFDRATGDEILRILRTLNHQRGLTIVMVTHDLSIAEQADRVVHLVEGEVQLA